MLLISSSPSGSVPHQIRSEQPTIHLCISSVQESHGLQGKEVKVRGIFYALCVMRVDLLRKEIQCNVCQELRSVEANIE